MARGGCQISTTLTSRIDARLETRLGGILSELMGNGAATSPCRAWRIDLMRADADRRTRRGRVASAGSTCGCSRRASALAKASDIVVEGTLNRMVGMTLEAVGCEVGRWWALPGRCTAEGKSDRGRGCGLFGR